MLVWVPVYWANNGAANFLWLCDAANFTVAAALWLASPLLFSAAAVGVLLVQCLWAVDFLGALLFGVHPIGGTEYMFDATKPLWTRLFSLFHLAMPPLLVWGLVRLGYHRRGWLLQTALTWLLLPASFFLADPERNLNWVWRPFGRTQELVAPELYFASLFLLYPLLLYLPSHLLLSAWARRPGRPERVG